jgi:hypothetical protein
MTKILASLMLLTLAVYFVAAIAFGVWIIARLMNS